MKSRWMKYLLVTLKSVLMGIVSVYGGFFMWAYYNTDTIYSPGYSPKAFASISRGMSEAEVRDRLGEPFHISSVDGDNEASANEVGSIWIFSKQGDPQSNYFERLIYFDQDRKVLRIEKDFYID